MAEPSAARPPRSSSRRRKKKTFAAACVEVLPFPAVAFPLFQAVQGRYVVWIHLIQPKVNLGPLEALANNVFGHAPQVS